MKSLLLTIALLTIGLSVNHAQNNLNKSLGFKLNQGVVWAHSRDIQGLRNSYPTGLEFNFSWHHTGEDAWSSCHCYPKLGVAVTFWNFDHPEILGHGITSLAYIEPVFGAQKRLSFSLRAGIGLSYQTKPYDEQTNPNNLSYSTHVAIPLQFGGSVHYELNSQWYLDFSTVFNHISNGGIQQPNKGINWPTASIGFSRYFSSPQFYVREKQNWRTRSKPVSRLDLTFFMGINKPEEPYLLGSPGVEVKYSRQFANINAFTLGTEWLYDNGTRYLVEQMGESVDPQRGGLAIGHEFLLGKFIFNQQLGYYWYKPYEVGDDFYQRYGLIFKATANFSFGINVKAYRHVADFIDLRAGWSFGL